MGHVEFPDFMVRAEFGRLAEQFLHLRVVFTVPVNLALTHKDGDVFLELLVELLDIFFDNVVFLGQTGVLNLFGEFTQNVDVSIGQLFEFAVGFFRAGLGQDQCIDIVEIFLGDALVGQIDIFGKHVSSNIEVLVLAI